MDGFGCVLEEGVTIGKEFKEAVGTVKEDPGIADAAKENTPEGPVYWLEEEQEGLVEGRVGEELLVAGVVVDVVAHSDSDVWIEEDLACVSGRKVTIGVCLEELEICEGTEDDSEGKRDI